MFVSLESLQNKEAADNELHKEEAKRRITHYKNDRDNIRSKWEISIDVFDFNHRPETGLINIGMEKIISDPTVNVGKKKI